MPITSLADLEAAVENATQRQQFRITKANFVSQVVGGQTTQWGNTGTPGAGSNGVSPWVPDNTTSGGINYLNPAGGQKTHLVKAVLSAGTAGSAGAYELHDRLMHSSLFLGTTLTAQTITGFDLSTQAAVANLAERKGRSDYSNVQWWLEVTGSMTNAINVTVTYTDQAGATQTTVVAIPAATASGRALPIIPTIAGSYIRGVQSVLLSATAGGGNFVVSATLQRAEFYTLATELVVMDWAKLGNVVIYDSSCLFIMAIAASTTVQAIHASLTFVQG